VGDAVPRARHRLARVGVNLVADSIEAVLGGDRRRAATTPGPRPATGDALAVEHVDVTYRVRGQDRLALRDVSFRIGRGESYGLVGESGSGKSTMALAITATWPATAG
jgi:ABC-type multidrug transport system fused ATPase/permease subunit